MFPLHLWKVWNYIRFTSGWRCMGGVIWQTDPLWVLWFYSFFKSLFVSYIWLHQIFSHLSTDFPVWSRQHKIPRNSNLRQMDFLNAQNRNLWRYAGAQFLIKKKSEISWKNWLVLKNMTRKKSCSIVKANNSQNFFYLVWQQCMTFQTKLVEWNSGCECVPQITICQHIATTLK